MPYSNATKQAFADALRKLLEQKPFAKISVSHICEECGMNRKSFYYHFKDKYDLVNWIFDTEITKIFSEEEWKNAGFTWDILEKICEYFYKHRTFYSKVLQIEGQNSFTEHFRDILVPVLKPSHQCCQKCIRKEMNIKFLMFSFFLFLYHRKKFTIDRD